MPVYPDDPPSTLVQSAFLDKDGFNDHTLTTAMHVGTHIDAPLHLIENGKRISDFEPDKFIGLGVLIDARGKIIDANLLEGINLNSESIVLVLTGHSKKFRDPDYFETFPEVHEDFAKVLADKKVKILGLDTPSSDKAPFKVHKILLAKEVLIIENLINLEALLGYKDFKVAALPMKLETNAAPVRVIAQV